MIPQRISIENFLSFGSPATVFTFDESEPLWVLSGPNGVGKSTVFDAITYALFGCHRGGKQEHEELIRHGSNSFRIEFEFSYDGERYRVVRSRGKKKRSVQSVERMNTHTCEWEPLNIDEKASGLTEWVEATIGLDYTAFTSSVLLKQGEADALINAKASKRLELLKKIVQLQPFEQLSARIHETANQHKSIYATLQAQFSNLTAVSVEELAAADDQVNTLANHKESVAQSYQAVLKLAHQGTLYHQATARIQELKRLLQTAEERATRAEAITADYHRWNELFIVVPILQKLDPLPSKIQQLEQLLMRCQEKEASASMIYQTVEQRMEELEKQRTEVELAKSESIQRLQQLEQQKKEINSHLKQMQELLEAEAQLIKFPSTLEQHLAEITRQREAIHQSITEAGKKTYSINDSLNQYRKQLRDFSNVKTGVPCSRCGQKVSKDHAAKETTRLEELIEQTDTQLQALKKEQNNQQTFHDNLIKQQHTIESQLQNKKLAKSTVETLQRSLRNQNITATLPELQQQQQALERELPLAKARSLDARKAFDKHIETYNQLATELRAKRTAREQAQLQTSSTRSQVEQLKVQHATILGQLPETWKDRIPVDGTSLQAVQQELQALSKRDIASEYNQLAKDAGEVKARREEVDRQQSQIRDLHEDARLPEDELQQRVQACKEQMTIADQHYQQALNIRNALQQRHAEHAQHAASLKRAEDTLRIHKRLDELLGKDGLQRQLVRSAEQDLVASASHTLSKLTNGELSLDLNQESDGNDAFDLLVRQSNSSHTTSVNYLSGSQKFRVSVAIALAIGKYASGRNRPLESVIIDEGFGSLDRDGLAAMAKELKELQRSAALKRIILVSHQEDFVDQFPVGYHLTPGEQGTTATRRSK